MCLCSIGWLLVLVFWQTFNAMNPVEQNSRKPGEQQAAPQHEPQPAPDAPLKPTQPRELGGRQGPDPTRYGDWELRGRCIDF
jgi:hypothetical protein